MRAHVPKHRDPSQDIIRAKLLAFLDSTGRRHKALGDAVGWPKQQVYRWLHGLKDASLSELTAIAAFYGQSIDELRLPSPVTSAPHPPPATEEVPMLTTDEQWIVHSFRRLRPAQRQRAMRAFLDLLGEDTLEPHTRTDDHAKRLRHVARR